MKIVIFSMGPGETSQANAVAKKFQSKGHTIEFVLGKEINKSFLSNAKFSVTVIPSSSRGSYEKLTRFIKESKANAVILCNSKSYGRTDFTYKSPWPTIPTFTLDSNWLFNNDYKDFGYIKWAEKYFINIPQSVFDNGLKQNGGFFEIDEEIMKKIQVVGLIPSFSKIDIDTLKKWRKMNGFNNEKIIFCYVSGQGAINRSWVLDNLLDATKRLIHDGALIRVLISGIVENKDQIEYSWCTYLGQNLSIEDFYLALSASHVVFQHQGLSTLTQAINAHVPVIANVADYKDDAIPKLHTYELTPFKKAGLCSVLHYNSRPDIIFQTIKSLLYNDAIRDDMKEKQKNIFSNGEEDLYTSIKEYMFTTEK